MRYALPLGAVLLLGLAVRMRPDLADPAGSGKGLPQIAETLPLSPGTETRQGSSQPSQGAPAIDPKGKPSEAIAVPRKGDTFPWRKIAVSLNQSLTLSPLQQEAVEQILRDRSEEIRICQEEIRKARLLDMRQYEWQVGRMKESWFRKIDRLLNSEQHQPFVGLVEQGLFNEGLGITEEPGMIVLD